MQNTILFHQPNIKPFKSFNASNYSSSSSCSMAEFMNITSHVLIYPPSMLQSLRIIVIQIHLMFLFIEQVQHYAIKSSNIQIHLMFLFITGRTEKLIQHTEFKYISCSYLSVSKSLNYATVTNSNTSHVLIYQLSVATT